MAQSRGTERPCQTRKTHEGPDHGHAAFGDHVYVGLGIHLASIVTMLIVFSQDSPRHRLETARLHPIRLH